MQEGCEDAVRDHISLLAGNALVVVVAGTAVGREGAVINDVDALAADAAAHFVAENGLPLAVEVGFEGVPHCLVEQDAGCARTHHHAHLAALGPSCLKELVHAVDSLGDEVFQVRVGNHLAALAETQSGLLLFYAFALLEDGADRETAQRAGVAAQLPERIVHQDVADGIRERRHYLDCTRLARSDGFAYTLEEGHELRNGGKAPVALHRVEVAGGDAARVQRQGSCVV